MSSDPPNDDQRKNDPSNSREKKAEQSSSKRVSLPLRILFMLSTLANRPGVHTPNHLFAAGFRYIGNGDTAKCNDCELEVSHWTKDMNPFTIHSQKRPDCPFVRSIKVSSILDKHSSASLSTTSGRNTSGSNEQEDFSQYRASATNVVNLSNTLFGVSTLQQVRRRTFSHWPHQTSLSSEQMIEAGFFNCNGGDRVICIYCNLICQQWTPHTDDPCEVHRTLSPNCIYVRSRLTRGELPSIINGNERSTEAGSPSSTTNNLFLLRSSEVVRTTAHNPAFIEIPKRYSSFDTWPNESLPPVNDLIRAGFFYTGTQTIVRCFYCNGSLPNRGSNDNPMLEHARLFPHCAYARQLCGDELYRKIQESKREEQEHVGANASGVKAGTSDSLTTNCQHLHIPDESTLSRLVAARLDLPISRSLLNRDFRFSIIKRCWEDQLLLKQVDFASDDDLYMACLILQKQIEHIDGKKENIVIPSIRMREIREQVEKEQREALAQGQAPRALALSDTTQSELTNASDNIDAQMTLAKENQDETKPINSTIATNDQDQRGDSTPSNPCVLCLTEEKRLACLPCGHLATCVPCGHSLRTCPICRRGIEAFFRIYI